MPDPLGSVTLKTPIYYAPRAVFTITVHIDDQAPGRNNWGFEIASRFEGGGQAGAWQAGPGTEVRSNASGVQYASHSSAAARPGTSNDFQLVWIAPPDTVHGRVFFDVAALAGDGSGDTSGDHVFIARSAADGLTTPAIDAGGISNAAGSGLPNVAAPGSLILIRGVNFSSRSEVAPQTDLPPRLADTSVLIGPASSGPGSPVPLLYVSPQRIYAQVPLEAAPGGLFNIVVKGPGVEASPPAALAIQSLAPAIFTMDSSGRGAGIIQHFDYSLVSDGTPARPGEIVLVYCSGLGLTRYPALQSGRPAAGQEVLVRPAATIGGQPAAVRSAVAVKGFVGLYQVNVEIPSLPAGSHEILLNSDGFQSAPGVTLAVGPA